MSEILPLAVGGLFDLRATGDAFASPSHGETVYGPAETPRSEGNPFTLARASIDAPGHSRKLLTVVVVAFYSTFFKGSP